ncbi:hypothetical protein KY347_02230 [Candidatus Woesearchaeota archaeon]|nr:hypothetical protein [Candidatus Woesearchaeota archaeon]
MGAKFTAFVMHIVMLITLLGLISMIFDLHRFAFYGEFLIFLALALVAVVSSVGILNNLRWAWVLLTLFFAFVFLDMVFIYVISAAEIQFFLLLLVASVVGFFLSLFSIEKPKAEIEEPAEEVKKTFKPGKYIASKTGVKFHAPKCDWAKRIKKSNAVWFDTKGEAKSAGYKADDCVR